MKNLEQLGLVALDATEMQEVQGGGWKDFVKDLAKGAVEAFVKAAASALGNKVIGK